MKRVSACTGLNWTWGYWGLSKGAHGAELNGVALLSAYMLVELVTFLPDECLPFILIYINCYYKSKLPWRGKQWCISCGGFAKIIGIRMGQDEVVARLQGRGPLGLLWCPCRGMFSYAAAAAKPKIVPFPCCCLAPCHPDKCGVAVASFLPL